MVWIVRSIFKIHPHGASLNHATCFSRRFLRPTPIPRLAVSRHRSPDRRRTPRHHRQRFFSRDFLPIGISQRKCDPRAASRNRADASLFKDAGAGHVPSIRQQQDLRSAMQGAESLAFSRLSFYFSHLLFPVVIENKRPRLLHHSWVSHFSWVLREVGRLS